jgi:tRNA modification GTPase
MEHASPQDTICALSTPPGTGALGVIRLSGPAAITICSEVFTGALKNKTAPFVSYGKICDGRDVIDEVVLTLFKAPASFNGEDTVEFSCHGSPYILERVLELLLRKGARIAEPGEFTLRAFLNGKMDLSQAEAVADLIASRSKAAHKLAMHQMRGGFSKEIDALRERLIHFASMIELELDFAEEDVEFADRDDLKSLVDELCDILRKLIDSFATGNVLKNGVPVAITGAPNQGKSTLLNALLNEERAIVSEIAGTTRDAIEDEISIGGVRFRFIDTAGIRETTDTIESMGINKALDKARSASVILYLVDASETSREEVNKVVAAFRQQLGEGKHRLIVVANKIDKAKGAEAEISAKFSDFNDVVYLSALKKENLDVLQKKLLEGVNTGAFEHGELMVTNARHHRALSQALEALSDVRRGLDQNITGDFLAIDIRKALHHLGEITGKITTDDLLGNIFSKFCIGK